MMKISIVTQGYQYTEEIKKAPDKQEILDSSAANEQDFSKTLKEIQDILKTREQELIKSKNVSTSSTATGYQSIAPKNLREIFKKASSVYGIDQKLLELVGYHESRFKADVTSKSGAMGVMQLMPETAKGLGVRNAYDPEENIMGGAKLLKKLSDLYGGNLELMLAGYSAGIGAVRKYGGVPPYKETTDYIANIKGKYYS